MFTSYSIGCFFIVRSLRQSRAVVAGKLCGRWGRIMRSLGQNRAVVGAESCGRCGRIVQTMLTRHFEFLSDSIQMAGRTFQCKKNDILVDILE